MVGGKLRSYKMNEFKIVKDWKCRGDFQDGEM